MSAVDDLGTWLEAEALGGDATDWPIVRRRLHGGSDRMIVLTEVPGPQPEQASALGMGDSASRVESVQVRVRGRPGQSDEARTKMDAIVLAASSLPSGPTLASTQYEGVWWEGTPGYIGADEKDRPEFTATLQLMSPVPVA